MEQSQSLSTLAKESFQATFSYNHLAFAELGGRIFFEHSPISDRCIGFSSC